MLHKRIYYTRIIDEGHWKLFTDFSREVYEGWNAHLNNSELIDFYHGKKNTFLDVLEASFEILEKPRQKFQRSKIWTHSECYGY